MNADSPINFRARRMEFLLCVVVFPLVFAAILWIPLNLFGLGTSADFAQFYSAGSVVASGNAPHLYDLAKDSELLRQFTHPPFEAILYAPFAQLPYAMAFRLWTLLNLICLGALFFLLRTYGPPFDLPSRLFFLAAVFHPILAAVVQGQDSLLSLLFLTCAFFALKQNHDFTAGLWLGAALVKPQIVVPFAIFVACWRRPKALTGLAVSALVLAGLSVLIFGPQVLIQFPRMLLHMNDHAAASDFHLLPQAMINLRGLFFVLLAKLVPQTVVNWITLIVSLALIAWFGFPFRQRPFSDLSACLALVVTLLVSFHLLIHDLSLILLPAFLFLNHLQTQEPGWPPSKILRVAPFPLLFVFFWTLTTIGSRYFAFGAIAVILFLIAASPLCEDSRAA
jgi:Glycosyltransferase family 87